jgi:hypothetical protein
VLLCLPCSKPGPVFFLCSTAPSSPPCSGAQGEPQPPSPCCGPGLRVEAGPSLVSSLFECCPMPARATAQTRRRLKAGHRAEPVALQVSLPSSPRALPCLVMVSYLRSDECSPSSGSLSAPTRLHRRRSARTRTYTRGAEPLSSLVLSRGPKVRLFWAETHGQHTPRSGPECRGRRPVFAAPVLSRCAVVLGRELHS